MPCRFLCEWPILVPWLYQRPCRRVNRRRCDVLCLWPCPRRRGQALRLGNTNECAMERSFHAQLLRTLVWCQLWFHINSCNLKWWKFASFCDQPFNFGTSSDLSLESRVVARSRLSLYEEGLVWSIVRSSSDIDGAAAYEYA